VAIQEAASKADPTNTDVRGDLSEDYLNLSNVYLKLGDREAALKGYQKALAINEELNADDRENNENKVSLAANYEVLGAYYAIEAKAGKRIESWQQAQKFYRQSLEILENLKQSEKLPAELTGKPDEIKQNLEKCDKALSTTQK
jgi:tetratricopeptide (TPR) repeat protein